MNITTTTKNGVDIVVVNSDDILITDTQSALDLLATVNYETGYDRADFIYESNKGRHVFFLSTVQQAVEKLSSI